MFKKCLVWGYYQEFPSYRETSTWMLKENIIFHLCILKSPCRQESIVMLCICDCSVMSRWVFFFHVNFAHKIMTPQFMPNRKEGNSVICKDRIWRLMNFTYILLDLYWCEWTIESDTGRLWCYKFRLYRYWSVSKNRLIFGFWSKHIGNVYSSVS